jgi:glutathione S-transferase
MALKAYVHLVSQPSRAVAWLLKAKAVDHELVQVEFGTGLVKSDEYLAMNPNGLVPTIKDGDFSLFEGNAILTYIATKYGFDDLYPADLQKRAKVDQYLHWHHYGTREFTIKIVRPSLKKVHGAATPEELAWLDKTQETIDKHSTILEKLFVGDYIASNDAPTVADFAAYCEYDQLEVMGLLANLGDKHPKVASWIERMKQVPYHDEVRVMLNGFVKATGIATKTDA